MFSENYALLFIRYTYTPQFNISKISAMEKGKRGCREMLTVYTGKDKEKQKD